MFILVMLSTLPKTVRTTAADARVELPVHRWSSGAVRQTTPDQSGAKPGDSRHLAQPQIPTSSARGTIRKRALRRAIERARVSLDGCTWYRGRRLHLRQLQQGEARTLRIVSWNAGGLHSSRYNELLVWLVQQADTGHPVDLLFIQESHWRTDMEYSVKPAEDKALQYHVVHSAGDEKAGLLCMIRAGIVPTSHIRHQAPLPGRLMHIRLMLSTPVDFLNTYQFAWNVNKVATAGLTTKAKMESMLKQRRRVWKHLEQWMRTIPRRHGCLVVGDLNTPVATEAPITGPGVMESKKAQQQDQEVLMEILRVNSCTVLNSWTGTGLQLRTFIPPGPEGHLQGSQIDYLIARGDLSNQTSRRAAPFEAPFVPTTGCRHLPLQARIPVPKKRRPPAQDSRRIPPQQVCHIVKEPAHARQLQQRISMEIVNQGESIDLDEVMIREWDRTRQGLPAAQAPMAVLNQQHSIRDSVMEMWRLRAALRKEGDGGQAAEGRDGPSLKKLWDSWAKAARLQALTRQLRKDCRHKKTVRLLEVVHSENVFQAAKRFAPKQPRSRVQFRSPEGHLQSHEAEFAQIRSYFQDLFKGPDREPFRLPHQVEFTEEEISLALGRLAASKAMPSTNAPAALWKLMGDQVVPTLHRQLLDALSTGATTLPATWNVSELILLPKPGKAMTSPSQLRPINLLTLQAKIIGSMVASRLQEYVLRFLWDVPQFAYVQSRSMGQALERVAGQCAEIRRLLQAQTSNPHAKREGHKLAHVRGGCLLSLDISKAYDHVAWDDLIEALQAALVPDYMITLIMMIHREARIKITHCGQECLVHMKRGLRQGCSLAPILWSAYSGWVLKRLHVSGVLNIPRCCTAYVDDFFYEWTVSSGSEMEVVYRAIRHVLAGLREQGLQLSLEKTAIILELRGAGAAICMRKYVVERTDKPGRCMKFVIQREAVYVKLQDHHVYLGTQIGFQKFEQDTNKYRLGLAKGAYSRLAPIFKCRTISLKIRLHLWQGTVLPTMLHGLDCLGLTIAEAGKMISVY